MVSAKLRGTSGLVAKACLVVLFALLLRLDVNAQENMGPTELLAMYESHRTQIEDVEYSFVSRHQTIISPEKHRQVRSSEMKWRNDDLYLFRSRMLSEDGTETGEHFTSSWNGEVGKSYRYEPEADSHHAVVDSRPDGKYALGDNPLYPWLRLPGDVRPEEGEVVKVERDGDGPVYVVKFPVWAGGRPAAGSYMTVWFSMKHGAMPVKVRKESRGKPWSERTLEYEQLAPGIWVPAAMRVRSFLGGRGEGDWKEGGICEVKIDVLSVKLNSSLKREDFDFDFPAGTKVSDRIAGVTYTVGPDRARAGGTDSTELDPIVREARKVEHPEERAGSPPGERVEGTDQALRGQVSPEHGGRAGRWPIGVAVVFVVIVGVVVARWRLAASNRSRHITRT